MRVVSSSNSPFRVSLELLLALTQNHSSHLGITGRTTRMLCALHIPTNQPRHLSIITDTSFSLACFSTHARARRRTHLHPFPPPLDTLQTCLCRDHPAR